MHSSIAGRNRAGAATTAAVAAALLLAGWAVAASPGAGSPAERSELCAGAGAGAEDMSRKALRKAVLCLTNRARARAGGERVSRALRLQRVAQRHADVMAEADCLASRCPGELRLEERIRRAGYLKGARRWGYAENTGCAVSAEAMAERWLESSFHRGNLLEKKFRDVGVGVVGKGPASRCREGLAVFSAVLAWRKA